MSGQSEKVSWENDTLAESERVSGNYEPSRTVLLKLPAVKDQVGFSA